MEQDKGVKLTRRDAIMASLGAVGMLFSGYTVKVFGDGAEERRLQEVARLAEISSHRYEVRVPRVATTPGFVSAMPPIVKPARQVSQIDYFLARDEPVTERDEAGYTRMHLRGGVLRYNPGSGQIIERLPDFQITNPVNIDVIDRFPQE